MSSPTPDSPTGSNEGSPGLLSPNSAVKKTRRQTAFYPNTSGKPQNPFSRSAAKRESVMMLGSIEHLQHYFTKAGFAAAQNPLKPNSNAKPALGPGILNTAIPHPRLASDIVLPPTPVLPPSLRPAFPPYVKTYQVDPEVLKPGVIEDLEATQRAWRIGSAQATSQEGGQAPESDSTTLNVLDLLKTTTRTIRSVRNYLVSLPDDFAAPRQAQTEFRPSTLSPPTGTPRKSPQPARQTSNDPLSLVRRSALEILTMLRRLEESTRIPLTDEVYEVQSDSGSTSTRSHTPGGTERVASPFTTDDDDSMASFSFSVVKGPIQKNEILVWSDDEDVVNEDAEEKKERWDEKLVLGGGWLYRQDVTMDQLSKEQETIGRYLDAVDTLLFGGGGGLSVRGWAREKEKFAAEKGRSKSRRQSAGDAEGRSLGIGVASGSRRGRRVASAGMFDAMQNIVLSEEPEEMEDALEDAEDAAEDSEVSVDDEDLPDWAKRSKFADDPFSRLMNLLITLLPAELIPLLPPLNDMTSRSNLLLRLSSGQILCAAYNIAIRRSRKPWGYINNDSIHDIAAMEAEAEGAGEVEREKRRVGWTFRRTDNLRLWAAALRLRYMLNVGLTPPPAKSRSGTPLQSPVADQSFSIPPLHQLQASFEPRLPTSIEDDQAFVRFDPQVVAKREEGWDAMLEGAVMKWMWAVVAEKRSGMKT
ncbi:hypothetical protein M422DRAFT_74784 [Sphaerobolus stellatus SS14]|uniref:Uncharacterized protein n=1 Tax=Sphaerobolus stellatus (strain SS14) TaxID=990650 RepID=A0A0C9UVX4_SPHS4|nr:hypothetical protein M422DRAFT_74784 [Sphaerobolus stellatus SS14]